MSNDNHSTDVPRIPAPPPNPRHTAQVSESHGDTSAQLDVTLEEVTPSFNTKKQDIFTDSSTSIETGERNHGTQTPVTINNNNAPTGPPGETIPVYFSKQNGDIAIRHDTIKRQPDGSSVIETGHYQSPPSRYDNPRPLTQRYQKILKILSIVAAVVFFPTGIPAALFAFRVSDEFQAGIIRGDIDKARKFAKRAEKLIIFSFLLAVMVIVITFALIERSKWTEEDLKVSAHRTIPI